MFQFQTSPTFPKLTRTDVVDNGYPTSLPLDTPPAPAWQDLKDLLLHREVGLLSRLSLNLCSEAMPGAREALEATTQLAVELLPLPGCAE